MEFINLEESRLNSSLSQHSNTLPWDFDLVDLMVDFVNSDPGVGALFSVWVGDASERTLGRFSRLFPSKEDCSFLVLLRCFIRNV